ncbi:AMP-binding protein [Nocardioides cavernae]|uniref:AMP-binding protein n=1 Tax=Nocardioides cavernae TaxID=1921566 RepID=A0ABR8NBQ0_9ACTN|nr:AMP-binding protein [Nocardioides cavernae]MBD3924299.1 AMP-binding protein [Nocardioides cavernae]MBM7510759.1 acyl-CoA synthetase (AMP-forming)/AMP-acid ligase II [Nocardioides cavernae]
MSLPEHVDVLGAPDPLGILACAAPDDLLAFRTAGTAGRPRTVLRTSRSWVESYPHVSELLEMTPASRVWVPGPLSATMNLFAAAHASWAGAEVVAEPSAATHAHLTPWWLRRQLADDPSALSGLHLVVAGDRLSSSLRDAAAGVGAQVSHYYGAAELSFVAWGGDAEWLRPFPGVEVTARDSELWVRSPYVCEGYAEPEHVLRSDQDGWLTVGDRGEVRPAKGAVGGTVTVFGRAGGVTTGGSTVLEADVEHALSLEAAGEVVVVGVPHVDLGQVVAAVVTDPDDIARLQEVSRRVLAPQQRPRWWFDLASLPLTGSGKVDKAAIVRAVTREGVDA